MIINKFNINYFLIFFINGKNASLYRKKVTNFYGVLFLSSQLYNNYLHEAGSSRLSSQF